MQEEFQSERSEFLDTIRELQQELKRKQLIIDNFIPPEEVERVEARARWDEEKGVWTLPRLEIAGNSVRTKRLSTDMIARHAESDSSRRRAAYDVNPRFKSENVAVLESDGVDRSTVDLGGALASRRVEAALNAALTADDGADVVVTGDGLGSADMRKKKDRPKTASRRKREDTGGSSAPVQSSDTAAYPSARGLVSRS